MERREYTPTRGLKSGPQTSGFTRAGQSDVGKETGLLRDYEIGKTKQTISGIRQTLGTIRENVLPPRQSLGAILNRDTTMPNLHREAQYTTVHRESGLNRDSALYREYELLKGQVRQLEGQNRSLASQVEKLRYEKNYAENKYLHKISFEEEAMAQLQKQKNYQVELMQIKADEESNKLRREYETQIQELQRQLKTKDYGLRDKSERVSYLQLKLGEFKKELEGQDKQLSKCRQANSALSQRVTKEEFTVKKLEMTVQQLEAQRGQMETQIHVLLDIEADKSRQINALQLDLKGAESVQRSLQDKIVILTENFTNLQQHIALMKQRLLSAESRSEELQKKYFATEKTLQDTQRLAKDQCDRENALVREIDDQSQKRLQRERENSELMEENQRLYQELTLTKHRFHDVCVSNGING